MGDGYLAELLHLLFSLLLFFPQFPFAGDVATIAFGGDVLGDGSDGLARDDLTADGALDGHFELLFGDDVFEFFADGAPLGFGFRAVDEAGKGVDGLFVDADLEFDDVALFVTVEFVIKGAVAAGDGLEFVVEVGDDFV